MRPDLARRAAYALLAFDAAALAACCTAARLGDLALPWLAAAACAAAVSAACCALVLLASRGRR